MQLAGKRACHQSSPLFWGVREQADLRERRIWIHILDLLLIEKGFKESTIGSFLNKRFIYLFYFWLCWVFLSVWVSEWVKNAQLCPTLWDRMDYTVHGILQARILEWVAFPFSRSPGDLPNPGIEPRYPTLQADSLPAEPWGKPKNTGVGGLSLLQGIFLTWVSNRGFLHCRWILYQLSYQGSPGVQGLSLTVARGGYSSRQCMGFSLWWWCFSWAQAPRCSGVVVCGL